MPTLQIDVATATTAELASEARRLLSGALDADTVALATALLLLSDSPFIPSN